MFQFHANIKMKTRFSWGKFIFYTLASKIESHMRGTYVLRYLGEGGNEKLFKNLTQQENLKV